MATWIQLHSRFINLANVCEVRFDEHLTSATIYFVGGGVLEVDEDDANGLDEVLRQVTSPVEPSHKTIVPPPLPYPH